jgi:hypothetical protein
MSESLPPEIKSQIQHLPVDEQQMFLLGQIVGELRGVNKHLSDLNGSVARHEKEIQSLNATRSEQKGERKAVATIAAGISTAISAAIGFLSWWSSHK